MGEPDPVEFPQFAVLACQAHSSHGANPAAQLYEDYLDKLNHSAEHIAPSFTVGDQIVSMHSLRNDGAVYTAVYCCSSYTPREYREFEPTLFSYFICPAHSAPIKGG